MKKINCFLLVYATVFAVFYGAANEAFALERESVPSFEALLFEKSAPKTGPLAEVLKGSEESSELFADDIMKKKKKNGSVVMIPQGEGIAYVNGQLCHIANYPFSVIYTVLEGPYYGLQTTMTYDGIVLYVNDEYTLKQKATGAILYHYYDDSVVITGSTQVIRFYLQAL